MKPRKRIHVSRATLSPFTGSAIRQLMAEFNRREDIKQCRELAQAFRDHANRLKKEPCRQSSKRKKRTQKDIEARKEWMRRKIEGKPTYVATKHVDETPTLSEAGPSGYDALWARQEQQAEREISPEISAPEPPKAAESVRPKKGEPGYLKWLLEEADRRGLARS